MEQPTTESAPEQFATTTPTPVDPNPAESTEQQQPQETPAQESAPSSAPPQPTPSSEAPAQPQITSATSEAAPITYTPDPALVAAMQLQQQQHQQLASLNKPFGAVKLFIGQLPKTMTEPYISPLFAPFGNLVEVAIIRNRATGESRGCAFVTYDNADSAELAIETLHNKQTLPGMTSPIQVKYAHGGGGDAPRYTPAPMPDYGMPGMDNMTEFKLFIGMLPRTVGEDGLRAIFQPYGSIIEVVVLREPDGSSRGCAFVKYHRREDAVNAINACNGQMFFQGQTNPLTVKFADGGRRNAGGGMGGGMGGMGMGGMGMGMGGQDAMMAQAQQLQLQMLMAQQYGQYGGGVDMNMLTSMAMGRGTPAPSGMSNQAQGPPGANLFIYHLPTHYGDGDLLTLFSPFGQILSVKVFLDKMTMVSKGFGFVSYASADSARLAIENMDGLQVGEKRLKVQLKKSRGAPY